MTGAEMAAALRRVTGRADLPVVRVPWWRIRLAAPFVEFCREALEMRYLWRRPWRLDNRRLTERLGAEPHTPLDQALRQSLIRAGCLAHRG